MPLFSHMQKASFLMMQLILKLARVLKEDLSCNTRKAVFGV